MTTCEVHVAGGLKHVCQLEQIQTAAVEADQLWILGIRPSRPLHVGADRGGDSTFETWTALTLPRGETEKIRLGTPLHLFRFAAWHACEDCVHSRPTLKRPYDSRCRSRLVPNRFEGYSESEFEQDPSRQRPGKDWILFQTLDPREVSTSRENLPRQRSQS